MRKLKDYVVPANVRNRIITSHHDAHLLNEELIKFYPKGEKLDPLVWGILGCIGSLTVYGSQPTHRLVVASINQTLKPKTPFTSLYHYIYRTGSSTTHLVECDRKGKPMVFKLTEMCKMIWENVYKKMCPVCGEFLTKDKYCNRCNIYPFSGEKYE